MEDECPKCKQIVSVVPVPWTTNSGSIGFSATCPHCGAEYDSASIPTPISPSEVKSEDLSTQNPQQTHSRSEHPKSKRV
jgi:hypothetical protein